MALLFSFILRLGLYRCKFLFLSVEFPNQQFLSVLINSFLSINSLHIFYCLLFFFNFRLSALSYILKVLQVFNFFLWHCEYAHLLEVTQDSIVPYVQSHFFFQDKYPAQTFQSQHNYNQGNRDGGGSLPDRKWDRSNADRGTREVRHHRGGSGFLRNDRERENNDDRYRRDKRDRDPHQDDDRNKKYRDQRSRSHDREYSRHHNLNRDSRERRHKRYRH